MATSTKVEKTIVIRFYPIENVEKAAWVENVYKPNILGHRKRVYKKPKYDQLK